MANDVVVMYSREGIKLNQAIQDLLLNGQGVPYKAIANNIMLNVFVPLKMHQHKESISPVEIGTFMKNNIRSLEQRINILPYLDIYKISLSKIEDSKTKNNAASGKGEEDEPRVLKIVSSLNQLAGKVIEANLHYG